MAKHLISDDWDQYPTLDLKGRMGKTDYIDFLKEDKVIFPVMKGVDCYDRPFIVIKAIGVYKDGTRTPFFQTFFQRYTENEKQWNSGGNFGTVFLATEGHMKKEQFQFLFELLKYGRVDITEERINNCKFFKLIFPEKLLRIELA